MATDITLAVTYFGILLGFGILIANLLRKKNIPDSFFLIILGIVLGPTVFNNPVVRDYVSVVLVDVGAMGPIPDFIRLLAIILITFTGAFSVRLGVFKEQYDISLKLALLGPVLMTLMIGLAAHVIFGLDSIFSVLIGAILSGTGSAVLYSFQDTLSKYRKSFSILVTESIFNSPVVILLSLLLLNVVNLEPGGTVEPLKYISDFWKLIAAGVGTGLLVGFGMGKLLKGMLREYTPLLLFSIALISFALAENIGGSGIIAVAVCGLIMGNMGFKEKGEAKTFDDLLSNMLRISVFTLFGAGAMIFLTLEEFLLTLAFFSAVFLARIPIIMALLGKRRKEFMRREIMLLTFVAPKGLESAVTAPLVAAAIIAAGQAAVAARLVNIVIMTVLLTIFVSSIIGSVISRKGQQGVVSAEQEKKEAEEKGREDFVEIKSSKIKRPKDKKQHL